MLTNSLLLVHLRYPNMWIQSKSGICCSLTISMCVCMHLLTCACSRAFRRTLLSTGDHQTGTCSDLAGVIPNETRVNIMGTTDTCGYKDL